MSSLIDTLARKGDALLFHVVWLPEIDTRNQVADLSHRLNRETYKNSFYELTSGADTLFTDGDTEQLFETHAKLLTDRFSQPHVTFMHTWATPLEAGSLASFFVKQGLETPLNATLRGLEIFPILPKFLGQAADEQDCVAWISVNRDYGLAKMQKRVADAVDLCKLPKITAVGDLWHPHLTLAVEPYGAAADTLYPINRDHLIQTGSRAGHLVLGLSGPNGQFRGALASMSDLEIAARGGIVEDFLAKRLEKLFLDNAL